LRYNSRLIISTKLSYQELMGATVLRYYWMFDYLYIIVLLLGIVFYVVKKLSIKY